MITLSKGVTNGRTLFNSKYTCLCQYYHAFALAVAWQWGKQEKALATVGMCIHGDRMKEGSELCMTRSHAMENIENE